MTNSTQSEPLVSTRQDGHILIISINREAKRNAIDRATADALDAALNLLEDNPDLWVGVLTGTPLVFCAGSDLKANGDYVTERGGEYGIIRRKRTKPLIAAVEGPALGGGMEIVLSCDMVVAASTATFGLPEVVIGVVPTCAALFRAPNALPVNLAREMILSGAAIGADRAYQAGFVNLVTEPGDALAQAIEMAGRIAANSPLAVRGCLKAINDLIAADDEAGWAATAGALDAIRDTQDSTEGIQAFFERRPPNWQAR